jgi:hypothetical protein
VTHYPQGWDCARASAALARYLAFAVDWGTALAIAAHVEACAACGERLALLSLRVGIGRAALAGPTRAGPLTPPRSGGDA